MGACKLDLGLSQPKSAQANDTNFCTRLSSIYAILSRSIPKHTISNLDEPEKCLEQDETEVRGEGGADVHVLIP